MADIVHKPENVNITLYRGDSQLYDLIIENASLEGATVRFTVKKNPNSADGTDGFQKEVTSHIDNTHTQIPINTEDTRELRAGNYYFDVQISLADDTVFTSHYGKFTILQDVTNAL